MEGEGVTAARSTKSIDQIDWKRWRGSSIDTKSFSLMDDSKEQLLDDIIVISFLGPHTLDNLNKIRAKRKHVMSGIFRSAIIVFVMSLFSMVCTAETLPSASKLEAKVAASELSSRGGSSPVLANFELERIKLKAEVDLLKEQNKTIREFQDKIINTVYWALGVIAAVFALLMSYSLFTNFRFYDQDKVRLKQDLDSTIESFKSKIIVQFEQDKRSSERFVEQRNEAHLKMVVDQGVELRSKLDSVRLELVEMISSSSAREAALQKKLGQSNKRLLSYATQFYQVEEMVWELKDNPACILITQSQALTSALGAESEYHVRSAIERVHATLKKHYENKGVKLDEDEVRTVEEILDLATAKEPQLVQDIRQTLKRCVA
jgi:hypothetical protein